VGRQRSAQRGLRLRSRSQGRATDCSSQGLHGHPAGRQLRRLQGALARQSNVQFAFCWSHVRRKFYELATPGPAPIASEALTRIAELYRIEGETRPRQPGANCGVATGCPQLGLVC
jgi:hypothetical protein